MFDTQTTFSPILSNIEAPRKLKQTRNITDDNLFGGLRVKQFFNTSLAEWFMSNLSGVVYAKRNSLKSWRKA